MSKIIAMPFWKKDTTPAEWLQEMAALAMEFPERFQNIVVVYDEVTPEGSLVRQQSRGVEVNSHIMGLMATAQMELFEYMKGRQG